MREIDNYNIYSDGRIFSLKRNKFLKPQKRGNGYLFVCLNGKAMSIHRLVALLFIENPFNKVEVNHKDGNKQNNHVSNLEWVTKSENTKHSYRLGLQKPKKGFDNLQSTPVKKIDATGKEICIYGSLVEAAKASGLKSYSGIHKVCRKERKTAGGFKWEFA